MKVVIFLGVLALALAADLKRAKRQAYELPDGHEYILYSPVRPTFRCVEDGYFADVDNNCQIFHVCEGVQDRGGINYRHHSFVCGNETVFNQLTLTCSHPEEAIPCGSSPDFFYLNRFIGVENAPFLNDDDIQRAERYIFGKKK